MSKKKSYSYMLLFKDNYLNSKFFYLLFLLVLLFLKSNYLFGITIPVIQKELDLPINAEWKTNNLTDKYNKMGMGLVVFDHVNQIEALDFNGFPSEKNVCCGLSIAEDISPIYKKKPIKIMGFKQVRIETLDILKERFKDFKMKKISEEYDFNECEMSGTYKLEKKNSPNARIHIHLLQVEKGKLIAIVVGWTNNNSKKTAQAYLDEFGRVFEPKVFPLILE